MKLLFLDIDGVLNDHKLLVTGYGGIYPHHANLLNILLDEVPDVQLVISSAWRYLVIRQEMTLKGFEYLLLTHGIKAKDRVHGITDPDPQLEADHSDIEAWKEAGIKWRAEQILSYLRKLPEFCPWVVFDDLPLNIGNLIQTDPAIGLTGYKVWTAIHLLNHKG